MNRAADLDCPSHHFLPLRRNPPGPPCVLYLPTPTGGQDVGKTKHPALKGCANAAVVIIGIPLLLAGVVGVKTWLPLQEACRDLEELETRLGSGAQYVPAPDCAIPSDRLEIFLKVRAELAGVCDKYGSVRQGFDSVASLEEKDPEDLGDVGWVAKDLGGASLSITPFLAGFFEKRNKALLEAGMGLEEYAYIYAAAYRHQLLSPATRAEIFSDGDALSPETAVLLQRCLARQWEAMSQGEGRSAVAAERQLMAADPGRLLWQDGLPGALAAALEPHREELEGLFCGATAGLEMERSAKRAIALALE